MDERFITKMWMLLDIVHKAAAAGPTYAWFVASANEELLKMKELQAGPDKPPASTYVPTDFDLKVKPIKDEPAPSSFTMKTDLNKDQPNG